MTPKKPGLMTLQQIADRAGVSRTAVSNWRGRHADFPDPAPESSGRRVVFASDEIEEWLADRGLGAGPDRDVATVLTEMVGSARLVGSDATESLAVGLGLLAAGKAVRGDAGEQPGAAEFASSAEAEGILAAATQLLKAQEERGLAPTGLSKALEPGLDESDEAFVWELRDLLISQGTVDFDRVAELAVQAAFGRLGSAERGYLGHPESVSSKLLADVAANLGDVPGIIMDPACGTGDTLLRLARAVRPGARVYGNEVEAVLADITRVRLWLHGINATITVGNALSETTLPGVQADVLVTEPPMGLRLKELLGNDQTPRDLWGVRGSYSGEAAFVIDAASRLAPGGTAYVLVPAALLSATSQTRLREQLVARGMLEAVIELPRKVLSYSAIGTAVLILRQEHAPKTGTDVKLIDATAKTPNAYTLATLVRALRTGATDGAAGIKVGTVTMADLLDDTSLQPSTRLATPLTREQANESRLAAVRAYDDAIEKLQEAMDDADAVRFAPGAGARTVKLTELIDDGTLRLVRCHGGAEVHDESGPSAEVWPVYQDDVNKAVGAVGTSLRRVEIGPDFETLMGGDVILPLVGNREAHRGPGGTPDNPVALSHAARGLRIENKEILNAAYFTYCLNAPHNRAATSSSGVARRALKDLTITLLPLDEQRQMVDYVSVLEDVAKTAGNAVRAAEQQINATLGWLPFT